MLFEFLLLYLNCVEEKKSEKEKTRLSRSEFAFVRETEVVLFVLCMCAIGGVVLHTPHPHSVFLFYDGVKIHDFDVVTTALF